MVLSILKAQLGNWAPTPGNVGSLSDLIGIVLKLIVTVVIIAAIIYLMINGLKFVTSGGDAGKAQEAQKGITYAIIGIVVALSAALLVDFVLQKLGGATEDLSWVISTIL